MPEYECIDKPDGGVLVFLLTLCQGLESLQQAHIADRHRIGDCAHQQIIGGGNKHFCQLQQLVGWWHMHAGFILVELRELQADPACNFFCVQRR